MQVIFYVPGNSSTLTHPAAADRSCFVSITAEYQWFCCVQFALDHRFQPYQRRAWECIFYDGCSSPC